MSNLHKILGPLACSLGGLLALPAHADLVATLSPSVLTAPASVAFGNSNVTPGTLATAAGLNYNFRDAFGFTLTGASDVTSLVVALNVIAPGGGFGVSNLQVTVVEAAVATAALFPWLTLTTPVTPDIQQVTAVLPTTALLSGVAYQLLVRGFVNQPGSYSGVLSATAPAAVPLPATLPLLVAGVAALGAARRRKA
jgi:hypothetical protein